jgi:ribosomal protein L37E
VLHLSCKECGANYFSAAPTNGCASCGADLESSTPGRRFLRQLAAERRYSSGSAVGRTEFDHLWFAALGETARPPGNQ